MRRDGREFISGSEPPRRFTEAVLERPEPPADDPDEIPSIATLAVQQVRANRGGAR